MKHGFTPTIVKILEKHFPGEGEQVFHQSPLLQYLNIKTASANRGSKARSAFGSIYGIYVLVEDYISKGYCDKGDYSEYDGAKFSNLLRRQRELPFGQKLQNHHLNHRLNQEFAKYFVTVDQQLVIRDL